ncbi:DUF3710 domain-containing protein [uncultured Pseudokineococcus sp.]|uniref:DUF3710 domain-containing protein n=1 Tax=uncultured Pseudokineococcus sp. TaxID=1642928 RepID=UPI002611145B|nr:DUF3710 domain-containing protein [uncultured Pseudokineococcus sp.]
MKWRRSKDQPVEETAPLAEGAGAAEEEDAQAVADRAARVAAEAEAERVRTAALAREARRRKEGPLDLTEVSEEDLARPRVDLGALRLPAVQGMELRLELEEKTQRVIGAVIVLGPSTLQLQAFAAPRTDGIWAEIRGEIRGQVSRQGGASEDAEGAFGPEVLARVPVRTEDGRTGHRAVRFAGVDGPRWFVRAVFGGRAAVDQEAAAPLEALLRAVVVDRGAEAMAPRDMLPLRLPPQDQARPTGPQGAPAGAAAPDGDPQDPQDAGEQGPSSQVPASPAPGGEQQVPADADGGVAEDGLGPLDPFHRGPETTETR